MFAFEEITNEEIEYEDVEEVTNGASWSISYYLMTFIDVYGLSFIQHCVSIIYAIYLRSTLLNLVIFFLKYVPTGIYTYKFIKKIIITSRERLSEKQMELEDIQLQIQIVNTKLCVRDAEFNERSELLRRDVERLRRVRARVRDVIAADDALRRALESAAECDLDLDAHATTEEDNDIINELLNGMKRDNYAKPDRNLEKMKQGEHPENEPKSEQNSLNSSLSDMDVRQDCSVKIVKVTNVYKVAYLKHYIKQKRLRRANKRAVLKKKMESIKKLLEDWQKTLNMVINSKLTILNIETHPIDVASQEAMGDYSKPRESSDSDSDMRSDMFYDEYSLSWTQNPYRPYLYNYEDIQDTAVSREYYEPHDNGDRMYCPHVQCECVGPKPNKMMAIVEETGSQMAIEEICEDDCRDLVACDV